MLHLFIDRGQGKPEDHASFFLQDESRRLTQAQYEGSRELYVQQQNREYLQRRVRGGTSNKGPLGIRWPNPLPSEPDYTPTQSDIALGRLFFARTKAEQTRARAAVRALASRGPIARRKTLRAALAATPQVKAVHSVETLFKIIAYRAARQFTWHFLTRELLAAVRRRGSALSHLLADPSSFEADPDSSGGLRTTRRSEKAQQKQ